MSRFDNKVNAISYLKQLKEETDSRIDYCNEQLGKNYLTQSDIRRYTSALEESTKTLIELLGAIEFVSNINVKVPKKYLIK